MDGYILAVDLGSSKIVGALARRTTNNKIEVVGIEEVPSKGIRLGVVSNATMVGGCLYEIFKKLQNYISGRDLCKVYFALGGHTIQSTHTIVKLDFDKDKEITVEDLQQLYKQNMEKITLDDDFEVIESSEMEVLLDGQLLNQDSAIGESCKNIEVHFLNSIGKDVLRQRIANALTHVTLNNKEIECAGMTLLPRTLDIFVSDRDAELGCVVLDFGAETTSMLLYQDNCIRDLSVIPFGGKAITNDLRSLNLTGPQAEEIKINYGQANSQDISNPKKIVIPSGSKLLPDISITDKEVAEIIEARLDEIMELVCKKIDDVHCFNKLGAGIIITGGGSNLNGIDDFIRMKTGMDVRFGDCSLILDPASKKSALQPKYGIIVGMLNTCTEDCSIERPPISTDKPLSEIKDEKKSRITPTQNNKRKKSFFSSKLSQLGDSIENVLFEKEDEM